MDKRKGLPKLHRKSRESKLESEITKNNLKENLETYYKTLTESMTFTKHRSASNKTVSPCSLISGSNIGVVEIASGNWPQTTGTNIGGNVYLMPEEIYYLFERGLVNVQGLESTQILLELLGNAGGIYFDLHVLITYLNARRDEQILYRYKIIHIYYIYILYIYIYYRKDRHKIINIYTGLKPKQRILEKNETEEEEWCEIKPIIKNKFVIYQVYESKIAFKQQAFQYLGVPINNPTFTIPELAQIAKLDIKIAEIKGRKSLIFNINQVIECPEETQN